MDADGHIGNPLWVRRTREGWLLLDGAHRLEAARRFGLERVPVRAYRCNDGEARLLQLFGNIAGAAMTVLDTAVALAACKRVYEVRHPDTKMGVKGGLIRQNSANDRMSFACFTDVAAESLGASRRHVERLVMAGEKLGPDEVAKLRAAPKPVTLADLQQIAKTTRAPERYHLVDALAEGRLKNAAAARREWREIDRGRVVRLDDPVEAARRRLMAQWRRAPKRARRRFVAELRDEIEALLAEGRREDAR